MADFAVCPIGSQDEQGISLVDLPNPDENTCEVDLPDDPRLTKSYTTLTTSPSGQQQNWSLLNLLIPSAVAATPPAPSPSLEETIKFIVEKVNLYGNVFTESKVGVKMDALGEGLLHWFTMTVDNENLRHVVVKEYTVDLKKVAEISYRPFTKTFPITARGEVYPNVFQVNLEYKYPFIIPMLLHHLEDGKVVRTFQMGPVNIATFFLSDEEVAKQVVAALQHARSLCQAVKEPF